MQTYSLDLRRRVVQAYEQGHGSLAEIAEQFSVSPGFVKKMLRQWRATGDLAPLPHGGGTPGSIPDRLREKLRRKVLKQGDISLAELHSFLEEDEQTSVHFSTISRTLKELNLPTKKRLHGGRAQQLQARLVPAASSRR
jgi:transposase